MKYITLSSIFLMLVMTLFTTTSMAATDYYCPQTIIIQCTKNFGGSCTLASTSATAMKDLYISRTYVRSSGKHTLYLSTVDGISGFSKPIEHWFASCTYISKENQYTNTSLSSHGDYNLDTSHGEWRHQFGGLNCPQFAANQIINPKICPLLAKSPSN